MSWQEIISTDALVRTGEVLLKVGLGVLLGAAIGWERELHGRPAGVRTHMLIVMGVVLICEVSRAFAPDDPARIASQIVTGIGFLGAGTILRTGPEVRGLTSAASIWAVAAIGMAVSVGGPFYLVALAGTILSLLTLSVVDNIERKLAPDSHPRELEVKLTDGHGIVAIVQRIEAANGSVRGVKVLSTDPLVAVLETRGPRELLLHAVLDVPGVQAARWIE
ncbi:MAG TPA: MgtC/SapB family protein [Fimbriimonadaceae bacterium]|nr:MgtC/SapB family protein [Fimbriimonadaceae bacterium]